MRSDPARRSLSAVPVGRKSLLGGASEAQSHTEQSSSTAIRPNPNQL